MRANGQSDASLPAREEASPRERREKSVSKSARARIAIKRMHVGIQGAAAVCQDVVIGRKVCKIAQGDTGVATEIVIVHDPLIEIGRCLPRRQVFEHSNIAAVRRISADATAMPTG